MVLEMVFFPQTLWVIKEGCVKISCSVTTKQSCAAKADLEKKKKIFGKGYSDCTTFWPLLPCLEAEADLERKVTIKVLRLLPLAAAASEATILDIGWRKSH